MRIMGRHVIACCATALASFLVACTTHPEAGSVARRELAIIGGDAASAPSGIAQVSHARGGQRCSGVLIGRELVATGKHCIMERTGEGDRRLSVEGFTVSFGPDTSRTEPRGVAAAAWVGAPDALSIDDAVEAGEDVAVLRLAEPAPSDETVHPLALDFMPTNEQPVRIAGFGLTDVRSGENGVRTVGTAKITGFDAATGIVQLEGAAACLGDSGGPVFDAETGAVLGIIGAFGTADGGLCDLGLTFAATPANAEVRRLLAKQCAAIGGCGSRSVEDASALDAAEADSADAAEVDAAVDAGEQRDPNDGGSDDGGRAKPREVEAHERSDDAGGCALMTPRTRTANAWWLVLGFVVSCLPLRRKRRSPPRAPHRSPPQAHTPQV